MTRRISDYRINCDNRFKSRILNRELLRRRKPGSPLGQ